MPEPQEKDKQTPDFFPIQSSGQTPDFFPVGGASSGWKPISDPLKTGEGMMRPAPIPTPPDLKEHMAMDRLGTDFEKRTANPPIVSAAHDIRAGNYSRAAHTTLSGIADGLSPLVFPAVMSNPVTATAALAGSGLGSWGARKGAEHFGATPDQADLAGDFGGVVGGTAGGFAGGAMKIPAIRGMARTALLDPVSKEPTIGPTSVVKRMLRTPEEIQAAKPPENPAVAHLPSSEEFFNRRGDDLMRRGGQQEELDTANAAKLKEAETTRQKELAANERFRNQHASAIETRGKQQSAIDAAVPKAPAELGSPENPGWTSKIPSTMPKTIPELGSPENPGAMARIPTTMPKAEIPKANTFSVERPRIMQAGIPRVPFTPAQEFAARQARASIPSEAGSIPSVDSQDLISRMKTVVKPGEEPTSADLKRAGDLTQAPIERLKTLAKFGDKLAQNEINRRLQNQ